MTIIEPIDFGAENLWEAVWGTCTSERYDDDDDDDDDGNEWMMNG